MYSLSRSFISHQSLKILNRLCDSLIAFALIFAREYPDIPFCPWLFGTASAEHFFGLARMILPDFTFPQFLYIVKHVTLQQRILLSGKYVAKKDSVAKPRSGYIFDIDTSPLQSSSQRCAFASRTEGLILSGMLPVLKLVVSRRTYCR